MKPGLGLVITGAILIVLGLIVLPIAGIAVVLALPDNAQQFVAPGTATVEVAEPGRYYLWHEYQGIFKGRTFHDDPALPQGLSIAVRDAETDQKLTLKPSSGMTTTRGARERVAIGSVEVAKPGRLTIEVSGSAGERLFAFDDFDLWGLLLLILSVGGASLAIDVLGISLLVWGIVKMARHRKANAQTTTQTTVSHTDA